ncbi:N-acetyltransferase family protein [Streptomyces nitrosporeus]|uniref:GNAT family N-acetyltransferase n=1 Tax=Streptomyces nitrosporeus TaxID=28894 RepID=UPI00399F8668
MRSTPDAATATGRQDTGGAVRPATAADLPSVAALCAAHAAFERAAPPAAGLAVRLEHHLFSPSPRAWCLVAEDGGELVGYATYALEFSTWSGAEYIHLDCLFVSAPHRGSGWGGRLFRAVREAAGAAGAPRMEWQTPHWNEDAIRFYDRTGAVSGLKARYTLGPAAPGVPAGPTLPGRPGSDQEGKRTRP